MPRLCCNKPLSFSIGYLGFFGFFLSLEFLYPLMFFGLFGLFFLILFFDIGFLFNFTFQYWVDGK